jgi:hypothetical protein
VKVTRIDRAENRVLPADFKWIVLKAVHDSGYIYKDGLARLFRLHPVTIGRVIDQLVAERFVRLAGNAVGCPYTAFRYKYFYTVTKAEVENVRPEITRFYVRAEHLEMSGPMPRHCFLTRRDATRNGAKGAKAGLKKREEWVPIHHAGGHVAAAFFASVINKSAGVEDTTFTPERVLRREKEQLFPMPDGTFAVNGRNYEYRLEFESFEKTKRAYEILFDLHERAALPTVYIALTAEIAAILDRVARNRKRVAIVMYGDEDGCASACEGLNADLFWQPPKRYLTGPKAGYDLEKAEDDGVPPPGAR